MPWVCPACAIGELHVFDVPVQVRIAPDGEICDVVGDVELRSNDRTECLGCGWRGTAGECTVEQEMV